MIKTTLRDNKVDNLTTQNQDFHQRRIVNAAASVDSNDYVIRSELDAVRTIAQNALDASGVSANISSNTSATIIQKTLAASTTTITTIYPSLDGLLLFVQIKQSGAGGNKILWDAMFESTKTPTNISTLANALSMFSFVSMGGLWNCTGFVV